MTITEKENLQALALLPFQIVGSALIAAALLGFMFMGISFFWSVI